MVKFEDIVVFARIAERESFTAAAKELTMSKSAVSKHISRLENELSLKLLHRSTHKLFLTEAGKAYYDYCVRIIGEIEQARISASGLNREIKGTLKVLTTAGVGQGLVTPAAITLLDTYDALDVEVVIAQIDNISMRQDIDIIVSSRDFHRTATRHGSLASQELGVVPYVVCASPQYLKQHGKPKTPQSLKEHDCLVYTTEGSPPDHWRFTGPKGVFAVPVSGSIRSNHEGVVLRAAVQGVGIARLPEYTVNSELDDGRLTLLFRGAVKSDRIIKAFYPRSKVLPAKLQAFISCLEKRLHAPTSLPNPDLA